MAFPDIVQFVLWSEFTSFAPRVCIFVPRRCVLGVALPKPEAPLLLQWYWLRLGRGRPWVCSLHVVAAALLVVVGCGAAG